MALGTPLLQLGLKTNFYEGYDSVQSNADKVATFIKSTARTENYAWLGSNPRMRKFNGERAPQKLQEYNYVLPNEEYEASIEVDESDVQDDQTGKYGIQAKSIGASLKTFPDELLFQTLLPAGNSTVCYDGQYFFDTDHPIGETGNVQSNIGSSALDAASFAAARTVLRKMQDDNARPTYNQNMDLLLVIPPDLENTAMTILNAQVLASGATNTLYNAAQVLIVPWLTDTNNWYLLNTAGTLKPFIVQEREFKAMDSLEEGSADYFMRRKKYYGTFWRGAAGYGLYQKAFASIVAGG